MSAKAQSNLRQYLDILQKLEAELPQYCDNIRWDATYSVSMYNAIQLILSRVEESSPPDMSSMRAYCEALEFIGRESRIQVDNVLKLDFVEVMEAGLVALGYRGTANLIVTGDSVQTWQPPDIVISGVIKRVPLWRRLLDIIQLTRGKYGTK